MRRLLWVQTSVSWRIRESSGGIHKTLQKRSCTRSPVFYIALYLDSHLGKRGRTEWRQKIGADFHAWAAETKLYLSRSSRVRAGSCAREDSRIDTKDGPLFMARRFEHLRPICKQFFERSAHLKPRCCSFRRPDTRHCERPIETDGGSKNTLQWQSRRLKWENLDLNSGQKPSLR